MVNVEAVVVLCDCWHVFGFEDELKRCENAPFAFAFSKGFKDSGDELPRFLRRCLQVVDGRS